MFYIGIKTYLLRQGVFFFAIFDEKVENYLCM